MRIGYGVGTARHSPSIGTAPALAIYDSTAKETISFDNPGKYVPPGQGQRPRAVEELVAHGCEVLVVIPETLCLESYELAQKYHLRFFLLDQADEIGPAIFDQPETNHKIVDQLPAYYYPD